MTDFHKIATELKAVADRRAPKAGWLSVKMRRWSEEDTMRCKLYGGSYTVEPDQVFALLETEDDVVVLMEGRKTTSVITLAAYNKLVDGSVAIRKSAKKVKTKKPKDPLRGIPKKGEQPDNSWRKMMDLDRDEEPTVKTTAKEKAPAKEKPAAQPKTTKLQMLPGKTRVKTGQLVVSADGRVGVIVGGGQSMKVIDTFGNASFDWITTNLTTIVVNGFDKSNLNQHTQVRAWLRKAFANGKADSYNGLAWTGFEAPKVEGFAGAALLQSLPVGYVDEVTAKRIDAKFVAAWGVEKRDYEVLDNYQTVDLSKGDKVLVRESGTDKWTIAVVSSISMASFHAKMRGEPNINVRNTAYRWNIGGGHAASVHNIQ